MLNIVISCFKKIKRQCIFLHISVVIFVNMLQIIIIIKEV